nr:acyl carrier protein [uncultured Rhodopila sp.]
MGAYLPVIRSIIRDHLHDAAIEVAPETRFEDLFGWDSMDLVSVVVEVECHFDLQFELHEIDRLETIGELAHMIDSKRTLVPA